MGDLNSSFKGRKENLPGIFFWGGGRRDSDSLAYM